SEAAKKFRTRHPIPDRSSEPARQKSSVKDNKDRKDLKDITTIPSPVFLLSLLSLMSLMSLVSPSSAAADSLQIGPASRSGDAPRGSPSGVSTLGENR